MSALREFKGRRRQQETWRRLSKVTPRGVHSNFRFWGDEETPVIARGKGSHIWDLDDNEYVDYRSGFGAVLLGHGYEPVCDAVAKAIYDGTVFTLSTEWELRVSERIVRMCRPAVEMVRFCNSGTEATMHAIRLARGYTGKEKVIKFEGNFHGVHDYTLWSTAGSNPAGLGYRSDPIPYQMSSGIPHQARELIVTLPVGDEELLEAAIERHGNNVAALIVEPVLGNAASITPPISWFRKVKALCDEYNIIFILDEVKTGFRVGPGGAQRLYGIEPDLVCYAKALGNGFPIAAFGGPRYIMDAIGPGGIAHGGTFSGNVVAMAAADKVLEILEDGTVHARIAEQGLKLQRGVSEILTRFGVPHSIHGPAQMWGLFLGDAEVKEFRDVFKTWRDLYHQIGMGLVERGVMPEPDVREPWFMQLSHTDEDIAYTLEAYEDTLKSIPEDELHPEVEEVGGDM